MVHIEKGEKLHKGELPSVGGAEQTQLACLGYPELWNSTRTLRLSTYICFFSLHIDGLKSTSWNGLISLLLVKDLGLMSTFNNTASIGPSLLVSKWKFILIYPQPIPISGGAQKWKGTLKPSSNLASCPFSISSHWQTLHNNHTQLGLKESSGANMRFTQCYKEWKFLSF